MRRLHVSLGHNASAVLTENGKVVRGYEQERLDRRKGSSLFPLMAINAALDLEPADEIILSHWIDNFHPCKTQNKHYDARVVTRMFSHGKIWSVRSDGATHHDAHALSAKHFYDAHVDKPSPEGTTTIVCDGFGLSQECLSVYEDGGLRHRFYGYKWSLGLMYQYTTGFLGLKENEDEFKLLGYEAHAKDYLGLSVTRALRDKAFEQGEAHAHSMMANGAADKPPVWTDRGDAEIDLEALGKAKAYWHGIAKAWSEEAPVPGQESLRCLVALQAQAFLEGALDYIVRHLAGAREDLLLAGGVFYNVKLNNHLLGRRAGRICVTPLSGDQGAALGPAGVPYSGLTWGDRWLSNNGSVSPFLEFCQRDEWVSRAQNHLYRGRIVNVVRGAAEFGPRALCNTTTFATPTLDNVRRINMLNNRNDVMPMAPVMTEACAAKAFHVDEVARVIGSNRYMVITHEVKSGHIRSGVTHADPLDLYRRTARPQIVPKGSDPELELLLAGVDNEYLINTSYNFHGEPIVHTVRDAVHTHAMQCARADEFGLSLPVLLVVLS